MLAKPERVLTDKEWAILSQAAGDKAGDYIALAGKCLRAGERRAAEHWAKKANRIYKVLIDLENEYYKAHPEEDPDQKFLAEERKRYRQVRPKNGA